MVGTIGGQSPALFNALIKESADLVRDESRVSAPLSIVSTSADPFEPALSDPASDHFGVGLMTTSRLAHFSGEFVEIVARGVESVLSLEFGPQRDLE